MTITFPNIKTIFFDFDGVLVDSVPIKTKAYQEIFQPLGKEAVDTITEYHLKNGGIDRYKKIAYVLESLNLDPGLKGELADQFAVLVKELVIQSDAIPGIIEQVKTWREKNIPMYIVSGTPEEELREIVSRRGWGDYFIGIYGSPRTKVEIVRTILQETKLQPTDTIFIGDASTDYNTALTVNTYYIGIPSFNSLTARPQTFRPLTLRHSDLKTFRLNK